MSSLATGRLEIIMGCMYSGKTTELMRRANRYRVIGKRVLVATHQIDTRYTQTGVSTHNREEMPATRLATLFDLETDPEFKASEILFIEEAQFFPDLYAFVVKAVEVYKKTVVISALDGDFQRRPFEQVINLVPYAEHVVKLTALCKRCGDGTHAVFSKRLVANSERELVGSEGVYEAVCRKHYEQL